MKLRNLVLTIALVLVSSTAFAKKEKTQKATDFFSLNKLDNKSGMKSMYVTMFRMNNGWKYSVSGFEDGATSASYSSPLAKNKENYITSDTKEIVKYVDGLGDTVSPEIKDALKQHAISIYQYEVFIPETVTTVSLKGGNGNGNTTETIYDAATNGNDFNVIGDDSGILYFGKSNWIGSYNNGAMFLIGGEKMDKFGTPLPAPVVTLLIALGFGAALVMYRNRKQVKA